MAQDERLRWASVGAGKLDYDRADVYLRLSSPFEFHRLHSCAKEPWTVRWIEERLGPGEVLFDVGANVGAYSLVAAVAAPDARVVAFEPAFENYAALCHNIVLNEVGDRVAPLPLALSERTGLTTLGYSALDAGAASHAMGTDRKAAVSLPALTHRLDELPDRLGLPVPSHLKLDVDGGEAAVLTGASGVLADERLRSVMVELVEEQEAKVTELLEQAGFVLDERFRPEQVGAARPPSTGLFVRS